MENLLAHRFKNFIFVILNYRKCVDIVPVNIVLPITLALSNEGPDEFGIGTYKNY